MFRSFDEAVFISWPFVDAVSWVEDDANILIFLSTSVLTVHMMFSLRWLLQTEALPSAHQSCIHSTSKEWESKNKCKIEFTLHTWMKYLFFDTSWKMQLFVCECAAHQLGVWQYAVPCVAVSTLAWHQDALQTFRSMRLSRTACCQSFSFTPISDQQRSALQRNHFDVQFDL